MEGGSIGACLRPYSSPAQAGSGWVSQRLAKHESPLACKAQPRRRAIETPDAGGAKSAEKQNLVVEKNSAHYEIERYT